MMLRRRFGGCFQLARKLAISSKYGNFRHGAVLVGGGNSFLGFGVNNEKYCSVGSRYRASNKGHSTYHAEIASVIGLPRSVTKGAIMFVARASKQDGEWRMSKPCAMCHAVMQERGISQVYYSVDGETIGTYKL